MELLRIPAREIMLQKRIQFGKQIAKDSNWHKRKLAENAYWDYQSTNY